jgi:hypothetical protein
MRPLGRFGVGGIDGISGTAGKRSIATPPGAEASGRVGGNLFMVPVNPNGASAGSSTWL